MIDGLPGWSEQLIWVAVVLAAAFAVSRLLRFWVRRWARVQPEHTADLTRIRRRETAAALIASAIRYLILLIAVFVIIGFLLRDKITAAAGATLVILILAFGAQRFLADVIAGFFILLENQYGVGDFIQTEPDKLSGVVEELGLRTTVLRNLNGDRYFIPNGAITGIRRSVRRYRSYNVELMTREPEDVKQALEDIVAIAPIGGARFLRPPHVMEERDLGDGLTLVRVRADVPPTMEWLAESFLVNALKGRVGEGLVAEPLVYTLDEGAVKRYERTVLLR